MVDLDERPAPAELLRSEMAAVRVSFTWFGVRKTLSADQKAAAAEQFGAAQDSLSASKKLLDTTHPRFKAVTAVRGAIAAGWKRCSLPFPEAGIRLLKRDDISQFDATMRRFQDELETAVFELDAHYAELRESARRSLGSLFNSDDYPATLAGLFSVQWDYPSVEPPNYLMELSPRLYEQECARINARFDEAFRMAETAFTEEFAKTVSHLCERLSDSPDGERKVFRDSAIVNLQEFIGKFRHLHVGSSSDLDRLVSDAERIVSGMDAKRLRGSETLRRHVATELSAVQASLDGMMINRPRRRIIRDLPIGE